MCKYMMSLINRNYNMPPASRTDRATAVYNIHINFGKDRTWYVGIDLHKQKTRRQTRSSPLPGAEWKFGKVWTCGLRCDGEQSTDTPTDRHSTQLNSTQLNRELRTQVSDTSKSASSLYTIINETVSLYDFFCNIGLSRLPVSGCSCSWNIGNKPFWCA